MLRRFDGHAGAFEILLLLKKTGIAYGTELSYEIRLDRGTCADTLTFLKDLALIEQVPWESGQDKKKRFIRLTSKGERVAKALAEVEKALKSK